MARQLLRLLGTRYGVALVLALLVVGIVAVMRTVNGSQQEPTSAPFATSTAPEVSPTLADDGVAVDEHSSEPSISPGAAAPESVALSFAQAWVHHNGATGDQWRHGLAHYATTPLMKRLAETDPAAVPAERVAGPAELNTRDSTLVEAVIPLDSGRLRLRLVVQSGRWLVDGVDWERP